MSDSSNTLNIGGLCLDRRLKSVSVNEQAIQLSPTSFELLAYMMQKSPAVISVDELLEKVWQDKVVSRETVKQQIKSLRDQLGSAASMVESMRGYGYKITGDDNQGSIQQGLKSIKKKTAYMSLLVMISVIAYLGFNGLQEKGSRLELPLKIAVLPFKLLDTQDDSLALLLQDELTSLMSRQDDVRAISISAIEHAKELNYGIDQYAKELGVDLMFEGSIRENEAGYQVNVRMIWTHDSVAVWRNHFEIKSKDREQIVAEISQSLKKLIRQKADFIRSR